MNPFTESNYARRDFDHYPTIDTRCSKALLNTWGDCITTPAVDVCTMKGEPTPLPAVSGTVRDMLGAYRTVITNPPYKRGLVDQIVGDIVDAVNDGHIDFAAVLLRISWDCAKTRRHLFKKSFAGKTILLFRPYWSEERKATPIHNYQWLCWKKDTGSPVVKYDSGE